MNEKTDFGKKEAALQYDYIARAKQYVAAESERVGHGLTASVITFGCQMNTVHEKESVGVI